MNKLPKVYASPIKHNIQNEQKYFRSNSSYNTYNNDVRKDIDKILNNNKHIYRSKVLINLNGKLIEKTIVSRKGDYLITIDNEKILIDDIKLIKEI